MATYVARGLDPALARQVAAQLMAHDALEAHARDELGISAALQARPIQAALASAGSFVAGALMPLAVTALAPEAHLIPIVALSGLWIVLSRLVKTPGNRLPDFAAYPPLTVANWSITTTSKSS